MLERRKAQKEGDRNRKSAGIMEKLFSLPEFEKAKVVGFYLSKPEEVGTLEAVEKACAMGKTVLVPVVEGEGMRFVRYTSGCRIGLGPFGVPEPEKKEYVTGKDVLIVPGVVFDRRGHRIGRGKGYYDRFLAERGVVKIGVAFDFQLIGKLPEEAHDIPMDIIITGKEILRVKG